MSTVTCPKCGRSLVINPNDGDMIFCEYCGTKININVNFNFNYNYSKSEHTEHIVDDAKIKAAENVDRVINIFASPIEERRAKKKAEEERIQREAEEADRIRKEQAARDAEEERIYKEWASAQREKHARQAGRVIAKGINYYHANKKTCLISAVLIIALLIGGGVYGSVTHKRSQELAVHQAELARLKEEEIAASHLAMGEVKMPDFSEKDDARDVMKKLRDTGFANVVDQPKHDLIFGNNHSQYEIIEVTVDGAPSFETSEWYPLDTEIVVSYHDYIFS